ncbi:MAG: type II toxin-antitoxin system VapC family toxin [Sphingomonas sp.]
MKITADTNILVRAVTGDDPRQSPLAQSQLENAELVAVTLPALCEFVWVLAQGYAIPVPEIAEAIRRLMSSANVVMNRPAVEAGLVLLEAGGDFADGVIAFEGQWLGAEIFLSFDKKAAKLIKAQGGSVHLLI